jgi:hypothetical protein
MTDKKTYSEVMAERERYPMGKPRPYTPDHPNLLPEGLPKTQIENPSPSGWFRLCLVLLAVLAAGYGIHGLLVDDLYLPGKRSRGRHYHGIAAGLIFMMIASLSIWLIAKAFEKFNPVLKQPTNKRLQTGLLTSAVIFMLAGIIVSYTND